MLVLRTSRQRVNELTRRKQEEILIELEGFKESRDGRERQSRAEGERRIKRS